jgi:hypothetical protein
MNDLEVAVNIHFSTARTSSSGWPSLLFDRLQLYVSEVSLNGENNWAIEVLTTSDAFPQCPEIGWTINTFSICQIGFAE